jgi:hypothetical protein
MRWPGNVACMGEGRGAYRGLVGKTEGKRALGISSRRWGHNIKIYLQEVGREGGMDSIDLAQDRERWRAILNTVTNLRFP